MKTIIATTDFSEESINAVNYAAGISLAITARLHIVHVFYSPVIYTEVPVAISQEELLTNAADELMRVKEMALLKAQGRIDITTEIRQGGFFAELNAVCKNTIPYAVVMGSQGKTAAERILFGGHSIKALQQLQWPLFVVPRHASFSSIAQIGLACDFDHIINRIPVATIKTFVDDFKATLSIINIGRQEVFDPEIVFESVLLEEKLAPLELKFSFLTNDHTDQGILEFIDKNLIDLLIMFPRHHTVFERLTHSGHTKNMILHSKVPVLALPA